MHMRVLGKNLFAFYFFHPVDMQRVLAVGPWRFVNHVMVLKEVQGGKQVSKDDLYEVPFWIQIHGLPPDRLNAETGKRIGENLGRLLEVDDGGGHAWGVEYIRVRVYIDARKPLRRGMKLSLREGSIWVDFCYERLPNFCYCCGMLDHVERDCELGLEMEQLSVKERPYNEKLRAVPRHLQSAEETSERRWLRDASGKSVDELRHRHHIPSLEGAQIRETSDSYTNCSRGDWGADRGLSNDHPRQENHNVICTEQATDFVGRISRHGLGTADQDSCVDLGLIDLLKWDNKRKVFDLNVKVPDALNVEREKDSKQVGNGVLPNDSSLAGPILQAQVQATQVLATQQAETSSVFLFTLGPSGHRLKARG
ncbi:hypothetical protein SLA2020_226240 [Shorea laevis]